MSNAPRSEIERIREELKAERPDLADWEASCLESVADLLEQLEAARRRWDAMAGELAERESDLAAAREERVQAEAGARSAERLAADLARTRSELDALRREREALASAHTDLQVVRAELSRERERGAESERLRIEAERAAEEELGRARASIEELGAKVELLTGQRDVLAEAGRAQGAKEAALGLARQRLDELERQVGQHLVEVCDLRARIVRIEKERDEAVRAATRKTKRILEKVHDELDDAGAPRGDEASFGERIRYLKQRIRDLERRG